jgi:hypothetical protein
MHHHLDLNRVKRIHFNIAVGLLIFITLVKATFATPLSPQEKIEVMRGEIPSCVAKHSFNRNLTKDQKAGLEAYCNCHASVMASNITKEEMVAVSKGVVPNSLPPKVKEAQARCLESLSQ